MKRMPRGFEDLRISIGQALGSNALYAHRRVNDGSGGRGGVMNIYLPVGLRAGFLPFFLISAICDLERVWHLL